MRYINSNYAGDIKDKNLIIRYCFFFSRGIITQYSNWQQTILISTPTAKYVAISQRVGKRIWIWWLLNELLLDKAIREMKMLDNNKTNLILIKDFESQNCIKHIDIIYHHICERVEDRETSIE